MNWQTDKAASWCIVMVEKTVLRLPQIGWGNSPIILMVRRRSAITIARTFLLFLSVPEVEDVQNEVCHRPTFYKFLMRKHLVLFNFSYIVIFKSGLQHQDCFCSIFQVQEAKARLYKKQEASENFFTNKCTMTRHNLTHRQKCIHYTQNELCDTDLTD